MNPFRQSSRRGTTRLRIFVWALLITGACGMVAFGEPAEDVWLGMRNVIRSRPADGKITIVGLSAYIDPKSESNDVATKNDAAMRQRMRDIFEAHSRTRFKERRGTNLRTHST
jgi:hypothetical protein